MTTSDEALPALGEADVPPVPDSPPVTTPVPVADQRAAGVPADATVTIADQKAGAEPPVVADPETGELSATQPLPPEDLSLETTPGSSFSDSHAAEPEASEFLQHASNASPVLPANAQASAARAHAALGQMVDSIRDDPEAPASRLVQALDAVRSDLARFVPASLLDAAVAEGLKIFRHEPAPAE